jgi:predicted dehydrogenase
MCQYYDITVSPVNAATTALSDESKVDDFDIVAQTKTLNIMLIGCGPHAKRVYLPALNNLKTKHDIKLRAVVELEGQNEATKATTCAIFDDVEFIFTSPFKSAYALPTTLERQLNTVVEKHNINGVIIATEPLSHMQYALWAIGKGLHILMDKPISTHENVANSLPQANRLASDFAMLATKRDPTKAFIVNAQRRYHPGFQYVLEQIHDVAHKYGMPITAMQSTHSDGQWRLPKEILTQKYHPYIGYGKVSHSGYHLIDVLSRFVQSSFASSGKTFDKVGVYSSFVRPTGLLSQQSRDDYLRVFGEQYEDVNEFSDEQLAELYKKAGEAEVDSSSIITLFNKGDVTANLSLNLMHNGFARRNWILPGNDLYKGNGRVKHEYHNIEQGPYQNIQIHSYQANDKHDVNTEDDYSLGGNNHFDIYIFRNSGILGGEPLQVIRSKDLAAQINHDSSKLVIEQVKHRVVKEFVEVVLGEREPSNTQSDLATHALSANLMSLIYKSGIKRKEVVTDYV